MAAPIVTDQVVGGWPPRWLTSIPTDALVRGDGDHACDFIEALCKITKDSIGGYAGQTLELRSWQRQVIRHLLARREDGNYRNRQALIGVARKNGKALDVETPILTVAGWSTMRQLRVGDEVYHPGGSPVRVTATTEVMTEHDCYQVVLSDGRTVVADADHLWSVRDRQLGRDVIVTTTEMRSRLRFGNRATHRERRYSVSVPRPIKLPDVELPIDPYLLGVWLGDGTSAAGRITSSDLAIVQAFEAAGYGVRRSLPYGYAIYGLQPQLRQLGVLGNKHVPQEYLVAGLSQRLALLQGLMDTDGCVNLSGKTSSRRCAFTSTTQNLAESVLWLARSLGWKPTIRESRATLYGRDCGPKWEVTFTAYADEAPFRLVRKLSRLPERPQRAARSSSIQVVSIESVESRPVRCIEVESLDGLFLAGADLVPTHNSALGAALALYGLICGPAGAEIYSAAGDRDQARIVFGTARRMIEMEPELAEVCKLYRDAIMVPSTGSVYRVLSAEAYCVVADTLVEQPDGFRAEIGSLRPGDPIVGVDGASLVDDSVSATDTRSSSPCVTVKTHRGRSVVATVDHPFLVRTRDDYRIPDKYEWVAAGQLRPGQRVVVGMGWNKEYEGVPLGHDEAWTMGAWVGDADKEIPSAVMRGAPDDWAAFLAGYLDTDGCVSALRAVVSWTSASRSLLDGCQALLARLGVNAALGKSVVTYRGDRRTYHQLRVNGAAQVRMLAELLPVRHPEKRRRLLRFTEAPGFTFRAWDSDRVVSVEPAGDRETVALSVTHTSTHVTGGLVSHNTKEGLNPTFVVFDEVHVQPNRDFWDVMALACGARREPIMVGITTAGARYDASGKDSLCYGLYEYGKKVCKGEINDPSFMMAWWEPTDPQADHRNPDTWREANPGFGDLVSAEDFAASVQRTPEQEFRIKRVNQWITSQMTWLPTGAWENLAGGSISLGADVVLGFDGSFNGDCTALVAVTVADIPHIEVVACWERPDEHGDEWQVPIADVEQAIRDACRQWQVKEIACDPFRWARTYQILEAEGLPVVEFPQSPARMTPATTRFYESVVNRTITRTADPRLARHLANAYLRADSRGTRIFKEHKHSQRRIDLAVAAVMALERACWWQSHDVVPQFFASWR